MSFQALTQIKVEGPWIFWAAFGGSKLWFSTWQGTQNGLGCMLFFPCLATPIWNLQLGTVLEILYLDQVCIHKCVGLNHRNVWSFCSICWWIVLLDYQLPSGQPWIHLGLNWSNLTICNPDQSLLISFETERCRNAIMRSRKVTKKLVLRILRSSFCTFLLLQPFFCSK